MNKAIHLIQRQEAPATMAKRMQQKQNKQKANIYNNNNKSFELTTTTQNQT